MLRNSVFSTKTPKVSFARQLRAQGTSGERLLWKKLRAKRFHGLKFRRQVPIGPYIVDFLCVQKKFIIEIDGDSHFQPGARERDATRERYLRAAGFELFRCGNHQVLHSTSATIQQIASAMGFLSD
jgi:very-short-patch-repair endonuclease